jgi:hypothetical protein
MPPRRRRIEQVPQVHHKDRNRHHPCRRMVAKQLNPHHLARPGIDSGAHQSGLKHRQAIVHRQGSEQEAKGSGGEDDGDGAAHACEEIGVHGAGLAAKTALVRYIDMREPRLELMNFLAERHFRLAANPQVWRFANAPRFTS